MTDQNSENHQEQTSLLEADEAVVISDPLRMLEAALFTSPEPLREKELKSFLPADTPPLSNLLEQLQEMYHGRGVELVQRNDGWAFRTAPDLAQHLSRFATEERAIPRAALEILAIIAYHQPVTRAEIEDIRGVSVSKNSLDILAELSLIKPAGRRETPGRPMMWATTAHFLDHFDLSDLRDLPNLSDMQAAGLVPPRSYGVPQDELPLTQDQDDALDNDNMDDEHKQEAA